MAHIRSHLVARHRCHYGQPRSTSKVLCYRERDTRHAHYTHNGVKRDLHSIYHGRLDAGRYTTRFHVWELSSSMKMKVWEDIVFASAKWCRPLAECIVPGGVKLTWSLLCRLIQWQNTLCVETTNFFFFFCVSVCIANKIDWEWGAGQLSWRPEHKKVVVCDVHMHNAVHCRGARWYFHPSRLCAPLTNTTRIGKLGSNPKQQRKENKKKKK